MPGTSAQQRIDRAHVDAYQSGPASDRGQKQVSGSDDLDAVDIDELVVQDIRSEAHLATASFEIGHVEAGRAQ